MNAGIAIGVVVGAILGAILIFLFGWLLTGNPLVGTPSRIAKHIRKTGTVYEIRMRSLGETWNPENRLPPARASVALAEPHTGSMSRASCI
jgi:hypothetical protein